MLMHKVKPVCIVVIAGIRIILHLDGTIKVSKITNFFHHFKHFDVEKCSFETGKVEAFVKKDVTTQFRT